MKPFLLVGLTQQLWLSAQEPLIDAPYRVTEENTLIGRAIIRQTSG